MAKKDPFEKFREATLGGKTNSPLKAALEKESQAAVVEDTRVPVRPTAAPVAPAPVEKVGKNSARELVSFHIEKEMKRLLGYIKFDTGKSYNDLYCEAVEDLLKKYGKL